MTLTPIIERTATGYSGYVLELGAQVVAVGDTPDVVAAELTTAAEHLIHALKREGKAPPQSVLVRSLSIA